MCPCIDCGVCVSGAENRDLSTNDDQEEEVQVKLLLLLLLVFRPTHRQPFVEERKFPRRTRLAKCD